MFKTIPITSVDRYIDNGTDMMLIDLRSREAFGTGHIKTAVNIPYQELESRISELPGDKMLLFCCHRGGQSLSASRMLDQRGYETIDLVGGMISYRGRYLVKR